MRQWTKAALLLGMMGSALWADRITSTALACPTIEDFRMIKQYEGGDRELYLMKRGCTVLTPKEKIHVLDPEHVTAGRYLRVQVERSNEILYVNKNYVKVEQAGRGNILTF